MLKLGDYNTLRIKKRTDYGLYLDGGDEGNILLPNRYVTPDMHIGDNLEVFIYLDQDERTIATTEHPIAKVGEFAYLIFSVLSVSRRNGWKSGRPIMSILWKMKRPIG